MHSPWQKNGSPLSVMLKVWKQGRASKIGSKLGSQNTQSTAPQIRCTEKLQQHVSEVAFSKNERSLSVHHFWDISGGGCKSRYNFHGQVIVDKFEGQKGERRVNVEVSSKRGVRHLRRSTPMLDSRQRGSLSMRQMRALGAVGNQYVGDGRERDETKILTVL